MSEEDKELSKLPENPPNKDHSPSIPKEDGGKLYPLKNSSDQIIPYSTSLPQNPLERLNHLEVEIQIKRIERQEKIEAANQWIEFVTIKSFGLGSLIVGGVQIIAPSLLPITLTPPFTPFTLLGIGLAFLGGRKAISLAKIALEILAKYEDKQP